MKRTITLAAVAATGLLVLAGSAAAQTTTPAPPPPSVLEICAATSIGQVDQILDRVATSDLVGQLRPLIGLTVPKSNGIQVAAGTSLNALKNTLECPGTVTPTTTPAPTTTPVPTTTPAPTTTVRPTADPDDDNDGVVRVPVGGVQTGYGPGA
jgi:hypothetical protein